MVCLETGTRHAVLLYCISFLIWLAALDTTTGGFAYADSDDFAREIARVEQLVDQGDYAAGFALADSLLEVAENADPPIPSELAAALDARIAAQLYLSGESAADAVETARRAVAIREDLDGDSSIALSKSLEQLGILLRQREEFDEAETSLQRALAMASSAAPPDSMQMSACLGALATLYTETGDYTQAIDHFERDLAIAERTLAPDDIALVRKYFNLSRLFRRLSDYEGSMDYLDRCERLLESVDPEHPLLAYVYVSRGSTQGEMGQQQESLESYLKSRELTLQKHGEENRLMLSILNNIGVYYLEIFDYEHAAEEFTKALELGRRLGSEESAYVATPMANLGTTYRDRGDLEAAEDLYQRSLEIMREVTGEEHPIYAQRLEELGWVRVDAGRPSEAEADFQRSWEIRTALLPEGNQEIGRALVGRARARHDQGELDLARDDYEAGLAIIDSNMGPRHPYLIEPLLNYSLLLAEQGDSATSAELALRAEEVSRNYLLLTAAFLSEQEALQFSTERVKGTDLLLTLAATGTAIRPAYDQVIRSRAMVMDEMAGRRAILVDVEDPAAVEARRIVAVRSREYADLLTADPAHEEAGEYQANVQAARAALEESQRELAAFSVRYRRDQDRRSATIDDVLGALPGDAVLISYARHRDMLGGTAGGARPLPEDRPETYTAIVVRAGDIDFVDLGRATEIDALVAAWREEAATPPSGDVAQARDRYQRAAAELRALIWDPVSARVQGAARVFICPDGELNLLNWSVLATEDGDYLAESAPPLHYLSAERDLIQTPATGIGLLAVGGVDYGGAPPTVGDESALARGTEQRSQFLAGIRFDPLPATAREVEMIQTIWADADDSRDARILSGSDATVPAYLSEAPGKRIIHLATHAFVLGEDSVTRAGTRGIGGVAALEDEPDRRPDLDAQRMRLSGLAFAGANTRGVAESSDDDGILTGREVAAQDLGSVEWAVLSACDTGRGEIRVGEGVLGLRRSFQIAGARTLIMSLWPVQDDAAEEWMRALYRARFEDDLPTIDAVRQASLEVLRSRRAAGDSDHPFYWGGFVAAGSWQ